MPEEVRKVKVPARAERAFSLRGATRAEESGPEIFEWVAATEEPVETWDYWTGTRFLEVLGCTKEECRSSYLDRGAAVLAHHDRDNPMHHVGVIEGYSFKNGEILTKSRFSDLGMGPQIAGEVKSGIRTQGSIGYHVFTYRVISPAEYDAKGRATKLEVRRATDWVFMEQSVVPIAADVRSGPRVGERAAGDFDEADLIVEASVAGAANREGNRMPTEELGGGGTAVDVKAEIKVGVDREKQRTDGLGDLAEKHGVPLKKLREWQKGETTPDQARAEILDNIRAQKDKDGVDHVEGAENLDLSRKERKTYSIRKALLEHATRSECGGVSGLEKAVHKTLLERAEKVAGFNYRGGVMIGLDLRSRDEIEIANEQRAARGERAVLTSNTAGQGAEFVHEQVGEMIEFYRNRVALIAAGARTLTGLSSPVMLMKQTGTATAKWMGQGVGAVPGSNPTTGFLQIAPKTLMAKVEYTRQFLAQSSFGVESWVRDDLAMVNAVEIDRAGFHGTGTNGEPQGIFNTTGVQTETFAGAGTWAHFVSMLGKAAAKNALINSPAFVTNPTEAAALMTILKSSVAGAKYLWDDGTILDARLAGYRALATNQIAATGTGTDQNLVFGDFSQAILAFFGGIEVTADVTTRADEGIIRVITFQMVDFALRHPEAFVKAITLSA